MPARRLLSRFSVPLMAAALASACRGSASTVTHPPGPHPLDGGAAEVRTVPEVPSSVDGAYRLREVDGAPLPTTFVPDAGCQARITAGTLTLTRRHFALSLATERHCGAAPSAVAARTASGQWSADVATLQLRADTGDAFTSARAVVVSRGEVRVEAVSVGGVERPVNWRFVRVGPLSVTGYFRMNRPVIQSATSASAAGAKVSSIRAYSAGAPVRLVWKRWLSPGISRTVASALPPARSAAAIAARFSAAGTWRSLLPPMASTG